MSGNIAKTVRVKAGPRTGISDRLVPTDAVLKGLRLPTSYLLRTSALETSDRFPTDLASIDQNLIPWNQNSFGAIAQDVLTQYAAIANTTQMPSTLNPLELYKTPTITTEVLAIPFIWPVAFASVMASSESLIKFNPLKRIGSQTAAENFVRNASRIAFALQQSGEALHEEDYGIEDVKPAFVTENLWEALEWFTKARREKPDVEFSITTGVDDGKYYIWEGREDNVTGIGAQYIHNHVNDPLPSAIDLDPLEIGESTIVIQTAGEEIKGASVSTRLSEYLFNTQEVTWHPGYTETRQYLIVVMPFMDETGSEFSLSIFLSQDNLTDQMTGQSYRLQAAAELSTMGTNRASEIISTNLLDVEGYVQGDQLHLEIQGSVDKMGDGHPFISRNPETLYIAAIPWLTIPYSSARTFSKNEISQISDVANIEAVIETIVGMARDSYEMLQAVEPIPGKQVLETKQLPSWEFIAVAMEFFIRSRIPGGDLWKSIKQAVISTIQFISSELDIEFSTEEKKDLFRGIYSTVNTIIDHILRKIAAAKARDILPPILAPAVETLLPEYRKLTPRQKTPEAGEIITRARKALPPLTRGQKKRRVLVLQPGRSAVIESTWAKKLGGANSEVALIEPHPVIRHEMNLAIKRRRGVTIYPGVADVRDRKFDAALAIYYGVDNENESSATRLRRDLESRLVEGAVLLLQLTTQLEEKMSDQLAADILGPRFDILKTYWGIPPFNTNFAKAYPISAVIMARYKGKKGR